MKWWHRWRARVWGYRLFHAKARLEAADPYTWDFVEAWAAVLTAKSAISYHEEKAKT